MSRDTFRKRSIRLAAASALGALAAIAPAAAQSLSGVHVGDKMGVIPVGKEPILKTTRMGRFIATKRKLEDGNLISVTSEAATGRIVYVETDWSGVVSGSNTDLAKFRYGKTTLRDIGDAFGSRGAIFRDNLVHAGADGDVERFNTFGVAGREDVYATFVTKLSKSDVKRYGVEKSFSRDLDAHWTLDAIILADRDYLVSIWGDQVQFDDGYKPIDWHD